MQNTHLDLYKLISFSQIFPYKKFNYWKTIKRLPTVDSVLVVAYTLRKRMMKRIDESGHEFFISTLFHYTAYMQPLILDYLKKIEFKDYIFIDEISLLLLMNDLLANFNDTRHELNHKNYDDLLMCYLKCCDRRLETTKKIPNEDESIEEWCKKFTPVTLYENSLCAIRDYRLGFVKGYELLMTFAKTNEKFRTYLTTFLRNRNLQSAEMYLYQIMTMFLETEKNQSTPSHIIAINRHDNVNGYFLDSLCLNPKNYQYSADLKSLRDKPLLKYRDRTYIMLYSRFFLDKSFSGILFDIAKENTSASLPFEKVYRSLKQLIGQEFSEHYLFYETLRRCFPSSLYIHFSGEKMKDILHEGEPDYYIRRDNKIFLFEFKDVLMKGEIKTCIDYDKIKEETYRIFVGEYRKNGKLKPKGVTQLSNTIETKLSDITKECDSVNSRYFIIYPILVYEDSSFDIEGFNYLLNNKFREIVKRRTISPSFEIKDLVMVNLDTLMSLENYMSSQQVVFEDVIDNYITYKKESKLNTIYPFNKYLINQARNQGYRFLKSKWFDDVFNTLKNKEDKRNDYTPIG